MILSHGNARLGTFQAVIQIATLFNSHSKSAVVKVEATSMFGLDPFDYGSPFTINGKAWSGRYYVQSAPLYCHGRLSIDFFLDDPL